MAGEKQHARLEYIISSGGDTDGRMVDWQEKILGHWELINRLARRRFASQTLAEEAALAVVDRLREDNWRIMRDYAGLASFSTYLATVVVRLLEDFARSRHGRLRPPQWIRALGGLWLDLFRLLCQERMPLFEAVEYLVLRRCAEERAHIENAACAIRREVVDCGRAAGKEVALDDTVAEGVASDDYETSEQQSRLEAEERQRLLGLVFEALTGSSDGPGAEDLGILSRLRLEMSPEERLLLKLCYRDGINGTLAAEMLGWTRFQLHGRLRRLMARIREEFERAGLSEDMLLVLRS